MQAQQGAAISEQASLCAESDWELLMLPLEVSFALAWLDVHPVTQAVPRKAVVHAQRANSCRMIWEGRGQGLQHKSYACCTLLCDSRLRLHPSPSSSPAVPPFQH